MPRVVLATSGSHGDLNPYLAIGRALKESGVEPVLATHSAYRADAQRHGLEFRRLRPEGDLDDVAVVRRVVDPWRGADYLIRRIVMPAIRESYEDVDSALEGADLLVSHVLVYAGRVAAEKRGLPWMATALQPMVFFSAHELPALPPLTFLPRLRRLGPGFCGRLLDLLFLPARSWGEPVRALREELGLPRGGDPLREAQRSPYGTLALFPEVFGAPQPDWPPNTTVCGFPFLDEDFGGAAPPEALSAFLGEGEPPVVFTLGSAAVKTAPWFPEAAAEAAQAGGFRAVILGGPPEGRRLGREAFAVRSAPYHRLFPGARAIVHSGGIGTTAQALRAGRPQVVVPFSHDQFDNAQRVVRLGCGVELPKRRASGRGLAAAVGRVLDPAFEAGARRTAERIGADGARRAAEAILARLRDPAV